MTLLEKLRTAVQNGQIKSPFTTEALKIWMISNEIRNDETAQEYSETYIEGFLSSSTVNSTATKTDKAFEKVGTNPESYRFMKITDK